MSHCCYILYPEKLDRYYVGYSSDLETRMHFHEYPEARKYTHRADDWVLYHKIDCKGKDQALVIEMHIKRMKSKTYIENLYKFPEISEKLLLKYKDG